MKVALVLSGGGARAAYQVGVFKALTEIMGTKARNPFAIICGSSAGAINASILACESDDFSAAVERLDAVWGSLTSTRVHELGFLAILRALTSLAASMIHQGYSGDTPWSLLDNSPLCELLGEIVRFGRLRERIKQRDIEALGISALGYTSGDTVCFFQSSDPIAAWHRHRRVGAPAELTLAHLMASTAIPGIYPAVHIHREYFGDGAVRQNAPLSPALHLGAQKLFVIGVSHNPRQGKIERQTTFHPPSLAQMTLHFLNGSFIDALEEDLERLQRLNQIADYLPREKAETEPFRKVEVLSITPSQPLDMLAARHIADLPASMRFLFKRTGATPAGGGAGLASYLLFEAPFIQELVSLGYKDTLDQSRAVEAFMGT